MYGRKREYVDMEIESRLWIIKTEEPKIDNEPKASDELKI
jgi:hypothetical protein